MNRELLALLGNKEDLYPRQLVARFPHVIERLMKLWGTADCDRYLNELLMLDHKRDHRQGFPPDAAMEIFRLQNAHGELGLSAAPPPADAWEENEFGAKN